VFISAQSGLQGLVRQCGHGNCGASVCQRCAACAYAASIAEALHYWLLLDLLYGPWPPMSIAAQVSVRSSASSSGCPVAVDRLSAAQSDPRLLLTSCSDGVMRLFDLRSSLAPVSSVQAGKGGLAGMVLEPFGKPCTIVTGEGAGEGAGSALRLSTAHHFTSLCGTEAPLLKGVECYVGFSRGE
jgi:hypothetical protein